MTRDAPRARRAIALGILSAFWLCLGSSHARPGRSAGVPPAPAVLDERAELTRNEAAAAEARASGNLEAEAAALLAAGRSHLALADLPASRAALSDALHLYRALGNRRAEATALDIRGTVALALANPEEALQDLTRALDLRRESGDRAGLAQTLSNLGLLNASIDDDEAALEHNEQAWQLFHALGDRPSEATVLHNLAEIFLRLGDGGRALQYGRMALDLHREVGPPAGVAHTLEHIASAYELLGDSRQASRHYELALEASRTLTSRRLEAGVLARLGALQLAGGSLEAAGRTLEAAIEASRAAHNSQGVARVLSALGRVRVDQGRHDEAEMLLGQALALGEASESARLKVHARAGLADLAIARRRAAEALAHSEALLSALEDLRAGTSRDDLRIALAAVNDGHYRRHIDILMMLNALDPQSGFAEAAYATVERARARTLLETLSAAPGSVTVPVAPDLASRDVALRHEIGAKADRLSRMLARQAPASALAPLRRDIDSLTSAYHEIRARIRALNPAYAALVHPESIGIHDVQRELLDRESVLLQFSLGRSRSFVWAITPDDWMTAELPGRDEIESLSRRTYELLTARGVRSDTGEPETRARRIAAADREWTSLSRLLSQVLLRPVSSFLGRARVIVVGDGAIDYLPFSALPDPTSPTGAPLVEAHEVVRIPSASALAVSRRHRPLSAPYRSLAIVADPVFSALDTRVRAGHSPAGVAVDEYPRLRFSRTEAVAIAGLAAPGHALLALDFAASRDRLVGGAFADRDILHLATHGILDTDRPELSGLVFSTVDADGQPLDGHLRLTDIYNLPMDADLVVLSGCETALGREFRGEGLVGLTRGFLYAGASRVIASLWRVDDRATAELMTRLYRGLLRDSLRPASALRAAQLEISRQVQWAAPYYWAGFELSGEWR